MKELLKNKKLVVCLSVIVGIIALFTILSFTLFSLKNISVEFKNQPMIFTEESKQNIIENSVLKKSMPVFALNKKAITDKLEKDNPYLKIVNIETKFPNSVIIHCAEREETFAVKAGETKYFICDADFKVLSIKNIYRNDQENPILFLGLENLIDNTNRANIGDFLIFDHEEVMLKNIGQALLRNNKTVSEQKALIKSIQLDSSVYYYTAKNQPYLKITDFSDFVTNIYVPEEYLATKFQYMFACTSEIIYNPGKFFTQEELDKMGTLPENYYLSYVLQIEQTLKDEIKLRLEKIS